MLALFAPDARLEFERGPPGRLTGRQAIALAFRTQPPTDTVVSIQAWGDRHLAHAVYGWSSDRGAPAGRLLLEARRGRIGRLVVSPWALEVLQVDAFTRAPFRGNPAAVVTDARGLRDTDMQAIAREMNLSETAFVLPGRDGHPIRRLRWFTPAVEVDFCGHATVAAAHALWELGRLEAPGTIAVDARIGRLRIGLEPAQDAVTVMISVPLVPFEEVDTALARRPGRSRGSGSEARPSRCSGARSRRVGDLGADVGAGVSALLDLGRLDQDVDLGLQVRRVGRRTVGPRRATVTQWSVPRGVRPPGERPLMRVVALIPAAVRVGGFDGQRSVVSYNAMIRCHPCRSRG